MLGDPGSFIVARGISEVGQGDELTPRHRPKQPEVPQRIRSGDVVLERDRRGQVGDRYAFALSLSLKRGTKDNFEDVCPSIGIEVQQSIAAKRFAGFKPTLDFLPGETRDVVDASPSAVREEGDGPVGRLMSA